MSIRADRRDSPLNLMAKAELQEQDARLNNTSQFELYIYFGEHYAPVLTMRLGRIRVCFMNKFAAGKLSRNEVGNGKYVLSL